MDSRESETSSLFAIPPGLVEGLSTNHIFGTTSPDNFRKSLATVTPPPTLFGASCTPLSVSLPGSTGSIQLSANARAFSPSPFAPIINGLNRKKISKQSQMRSNSPLSNTSESSSLAPIVSDVDSRLTPDQYERLRVQTENSGNSTPASTRLADFYPRSLSESPGIYSDRGRRNSNAAESFPSWNHFITPRSAHDKEDVVPCFPSAYGKDFNSSFSTPKSNNSNGDVQRIQSRSCPLSVDQGLLQVKKEFNPSQSPIAKPIGVRPGSSALSKWDLDANSTSVQELSTSVDWGLPSTETDSKDTIGLIGGGKSQFGLESFSSDKFKTEIKPFNLSLEERLLISGYHENYSQQGLSEDYKKRVENLLRSVFDGEYDLMPLIEEQKRKNTKIMEYAKQLDFELDGVTDTYRGDACGDKCQYAQIVPKTAASVLSNAGKGSLTDYNRPVKTFQKSDTMLCGHEYIIPEPTHQVPECLQNYKFARICSECHVQNKIGVDGFHYRPLKGHLCLKTVLVAKSTKSTWSRVRSIPRHIDYKGPFLQCRHISQGEICPYGESCTFCYNKEEEEIWTFERRGLFNRNKIFQEMFKNDLSGDNKEETPLNALDIKQRWICSSCFKNGQQVQRKNKSNYCSARSCHAWRDPVLICHIDKWSVVRDLVNVFSKSTPSLPQAFVVCKSIREKNKCDYGDLCQFSHSDEECRVWNYMRENHVKSLKQLYMMLVK